MDRRLAIFVSLLATAIALWTGRPLFAQDPSGEAIIRRSEEAIQADFNAAPRYACNETDQEQNGSKTYEDLMIEGSPYQRLIAINGQPLSEADRQKEEEKLQNEIRQRKQESPARRQRRIAEYENERRRNHFMLQQLTKAFNFKLAGRDNVDGHETFALQATPKPGYRPPNNQTKALTGMQGNLWVDTQTYQWVKVEAEAVRPVTIDGFLARVEPGTKFELEKAPVGDGIWLPKHFSMKARAEILGLIPKNESEDEIYTHCHSATSPA